jgi:signal transduction histidine kinase
MAYSLSATVAIVALAGLGVFVIERHRGRQANRLLGGFLLTVAGFLLSALAVQWLTSQSTRPIANLGIRDLSTWMQMANRMVIVFATLFPSLLLHFALEFPRPSLFARTRYVYALYLPGLLLLPLLLTRSLAPFPQFQSYPASPWFAIWRIWLLLYLLLSVVALYLSYRRAASRIEKQQLALMLVGLGVPFVALPVGWQFSGWVQSGWGNATWIFAAALLSYGIARYQLLDIRIAVRRALVYSSLTALVTLLYVGVALAVNLLSASLSDSLARVVNALLIVGIAILLIPTRERAQRVVDRLFFRGEVGRQEMLRQFSRELHTELTEEGVANCTLQRLVDALDANAAYLFMEDQGIFSAAYHHGGVAPRGLAQQFRRDDDLIRWLARYQEGATLEQMRLDPRFGTTYVRSWARLDAMDAALCLPLLNAESGLIGVIFVDRKRMGRAYNVDDLRFAQVVCNQAAIALESARLLRKTSEAERLAALGRMASAILHDLRTPIGGMMRCVETLGQDELPTEIRSRLAHSTLEMMNRLYHMAQQVLDYSRGGWELEYQAVQMRDFIQQHIPLLETDLQAHGISLALALDYEGEVVMDPNRISQVVYNLVSNARDAMPGGGILTLATSASDGEIRLSVADTGGGIPPERLNRIFEPFVSYKSDRGAGLGLSICRKIVVDHGGSIQVESQVGVGSSFVVSLPHRPSEKPADNHKHENANSEDPVHLSLR